MEPCESYLDTYEGTLQQGLCSLGGGHVHYLSGCGDKNETLAAQRRKGVFQLLILEVSVYSLWPHGCWA